MSCIVFAGSAQGVLAQLIAASTPSLVVILTAFIVNIRHMLYSASVSAYTCKLHPLWKWLLAYLLTDEAYAVIILHYQKPGDTKQKHWYFLGAGLALWTTWQLSTAVGMFLGGRIPASWSLDFVSTLTFIALVVPALKDHVSTTAALTAALSALLVIAVPLKLGIALAALVGIAVGLTLEKSYGAAKREILPGVEQRQHKRLNNRAENSHQPTRLREQNMRRFKSAKQAQRILSADRAHLRAFQAKETSFESSGLPCEITRSIPGVERGNQAPTRCVTIILTQLLTSSRLSPL